MVAPTGLIDASELADSRAARIEVWDGRHSHITAEGGGQTACGSVGDRLERQYEQLAPKPWRGVRAMAMGLIATVCDRLLHIIRRYHRWGHRKGADDNAAAGVTINKPQETTKRSLVQSAPQVERTEHKRGGDQGAGSPV